MLSEEKYKLVTEKRGETEKGRNNRMNKNEQPDCNIHNTLYLFFMFVLFHFLCLAVLEQKCYEKFKCLNTGEKEK